MRLFPHGFYADLGLRLSDVWEASGEDCRLVASTWINPRRFEKPGWLDADSALAGTPRAIFFRWQDQDER